MSNLNVAALKRLFPKNSKGKNHVDGANRVRVQVLLPPDTKARLDKLVGTDSDARSAAMALGVEVLCTISYSKHPPEFEELADRLAAIMEPGKTGIGLSWMATYLAYLASQP